MIKEEGVDQEFGDLEEGEEGPVKSKSPTAFPSSILHAYGADCLRFTGWRRSTRAEN